MKRPKLLLLRPFSTRDRQALLGQLSSLYEIIEPTDYDEATLIKLVPSVEVALGPTISPAVLRAAMGLRLLHTPGAGLEKLDLPALAALSVTVCRSASHALQVAEHGVAMLLSLMRKVALHDRLLRSGIWYRPQGTPDDELYQTDTLQGATIGLLGYGAINQAASRMLTAFGVHILVCARHPHPTVRMAELTDLMMQSDAIIIAVPLTDSTRGMIGARELSLRQHGPYLVNVGRAEVVDRAALRDALASRQIRGAALDVPYDGTDGYAGLADFTAFDNTILSPHRAGTLRGCTPHLSDVIENLIAYAQGKPLKNVVDLELGY